MISPKEIIQVGRTQKPHGIKGEINIIFSNVEYAELDCEYYLLMIDNIPVPFFIEEFTFTTDVAARVKFDAVDDEKEAAKLINLDICVPTNLVKQQEDSIAPGWSHFIGFDVVNIDNEHIGTIVKVDDSTINILFVLENEEKEILIPATEDFIAVIDEKGKIIKMDLPEGLLED